MDQAGKDTGDKHPDIVKTVRNDESHSRYDASDDGEGRRLLEEELREQSDSSVSKALCTQAWGPEFNSRNSYKMLGMVAHSCNATLGRQRQESPWIAKLETSRSPQTLHLKKTQGGQCLKSDL